ncbi:MAG: hypothetical protein J7K36_00685, partial [Archaeoglobaceae archaeon]|nr:hypothetical protein [Archaeoglobaceae archaeon]
NECEEKERELLFILEELFTHSRKLKTIWKRDYEYINFIKDFFEKKKSDIERIFGDLVENLKKQGFMVTENYIDFIKSIQYLDEKVKGWRHATSKLENDLRRAFKDNNLFCASVLHKLNTGLSKELEKTLKVLIISEENNKVKSSVKPFREVSNVANYLEEYICRSTSFIVYYKEDLEREKILENLYDPFLEVIEYLVEEYRRMGVV